jgi:hypothetical protein
MNHILEIKGNEEKEKEIIKIKKEEDAFEDNHYLNGFR